MYNREQKGKFVIKYGKSKARKGTTKLIERVKTRYNLGLVGFGLYTFEL